jgi:hypothetical protein
MRPGKVVDFDKMARSLSREAVVAEVRRNPVLGRLLLSVRVSNLSIDSIVGAIVLAYFLGKESVVELSETERVIERMIAGIDTNTGVFLDAIEGLHAGRRDV